MDYPTILFLHWIVRKVTPQVVFFRETKAKQDLVDRLVVSLGYKYIVAIDAEDNVRGLFVFWLPSVNIVVSNTNKNCIVCKVADVRHRVKYEWKLVLV